jgi:hypothetical protein
MIRLLTAGILVCYLATAVMGQEVVMPLSGVPMAVPSASPAADAQAKDKQSEKPDAKKLEVEVSTLVDGLKNPFSITIEPESDRIFVAESGAQRIVEIKEAKPVLVAGDFPASKYRGYDVGPLSVFCPKPNMLVAGFDDDNGVGNLALLKLAAEEADAKTSVKARQSVAFKPKENGSKLGQFTSLIAKHSVVYVVTNGDADNGWIALAELQNETVQSFRASIDTAKKSSFPNPTCVTVSPGGEYLVVAQMGKEGEAKDSRLTFYTLQGKIKLNLEVGLHDIVALAYSPNRKHLFAIDYNYADPTKGGLYKLIADGADKCKVKKLQDLSFATSMAFDSKGNLYVTKLGGPAGSENADQGKLLKITGLDQNPVKAAPESAAANDAKKESVE